MNKKLIGSVVLVLACKAALRADNLPTDGLNNQILYWNATAVTGSNATWGDPRSIPGLQGPQGVAGLNGVDGVAGTNGTNGTNGVDGAPGTNGTNGVDGKDGVNGAKGDKGDTGDKGAKGDKGNKGDKGDAGAQGRNAYMGTLVAGELDVRVLDTRHFQVNLFDLYTLGDVGHNAMYGMKFQVKLGKSYEERLIEQLRAEIKNQAVSDAAALLQ